MRPVLCFYPDSFGEALLKVFGSRGCLLVEARGSQNATPCYSRRTCPAVRFTSSRFLEAAAPVLDIFEETLTLT